MEWLCRLAWLWILIGSLWPLALAALIVAWML